MKFDIGGVSTLPYFFLVNILLGNKQSLTLKYQTKYMTKKLQLRSDLPETARQELAEAGLQDFNVGDIYMTYDKGHDRYSCLYRINNIRTKKGKIEYIEFGKSTTWEGTEFSDSYGGEYSAERMSKRIIDEEWLKVTLEDIAAYRQKALDFIEGKIDTTDFEDSSTDVVNSETAIMGKSSKQALIAMNEGIQKKKETAMLMARFVGREMEQRKQELNKLREKMYGVVAVFQKKLKKIMRVITTIELYLGIDEELFCIQEGEKAPADTPITFRQAVLYMDEEIGHWKDGGLDFNDIGWFDEWLAKDDNYKKCLPEEKGLVVFRPRRYEKDYQSGNALYDAAKNKANMYNTYLLVRNGEQLYRVYTEKIVILPRLFPKRAELVELMSKIQATMDEDGSFSEEREKEKADDMFYQYRKRAVLMQGLIDRTEIFHPLPAEKINIFDLEAVADKVNFVYDDEALLGMGKLTFSDWHEKLNEGITHGSRVLITGHYRDNIGSRRDNTDRIFYYVNEHKAPSLPMEGLYDVEEYKQEDRAWLREEDYEEAKANGDVMTVLETRQDRCVRHWEEGDPRKKEFGSKHVKDTDDYIKEYRVEYIHRHLTILHNPQDTVYGGWGRYEPKERTKRIRFKIYPRDTFLLNYDKLDLADIDFYINSRIDRPNYLHMMPVLVKVRTFLLEEKEKEQDFLKLIYGQVYKELSDKLTEVQIYSRINKCLDWWKYKNSLKRAITKDDALAFRMIAGRVTSKNWAKLIWDK